MLCFGDSSTFPELSSTGALFLGRLGVCGEQHQRHISA